MASSVCSNPSPYEPSFYYYVAPPPPRESGEPEICPVCIENPEEGSSKRWVAHHRPLTDRVENRTDKLEHHIHAECLENYVKTLGKNDAPCAICRTVYQCPPQTLKKPFPFFTQIPPVGIWACYYLFLLKLNQPMGPFVKGITLVLAPAILQFITASKLNNDKDETQVPFRLKESWKFMLYATGTIWGVSWIATFPYNPGMIYLIMPLISLDLANCCYYKKYFDDAFFFYPSTKSLREMVPARITQQALILGSWVLCQYQSITMRTPIGFFASCVWLFLCPGVIQLVSANSLNQFNQEKGTKIPIQKPLEIMIATNLLFCYLGMNDLLWKENALVFLGLPIMAAKLGNALSGYTFFQNETARSYAKQLAVGLLCYQSLLVGFESFLPSTFYK